MVKNQEQTSQEVAAAKFSGPRTRSQEKKLRLQSERDVTVSAGADKGGSEDPEEEKGRFLQQLETPPSVSSKLQELLESSSQETSSTSFLELDIELAKAQTTPDVASDTHLQDEQGSNTPTPPVDASVEQHLDEDGRRTTTTTTNDQVINKIFPSLYFPGTLVDKDDKNKLTTYFVNFNKTLLAYLLAKAINHLAMILAQKIWT